MLARILCAIIIIKGFNMQVEKLFPVAAAAVMLVLILLAAPTVLFAALCAANPGWLAGTVTAVAPVFTARAALSATTAPDVSPADVIKDAKSEDMYAAAHEGVSAFACLGYEKNTRGDKTIEAIPTIRRYFCNRKVICQIIPYFTRMYPGWLEENVAFSFKNMAFSAESAETRLCAAVSYSVVAFMAPTGSVGAFCIF